MSVRRFRRGDTLTAERLNDLVDAVNAGITLRPGPGLEVRQTRNGTVISLRPGALEPGGSSKDGFHARITAANALDATRWRYSFEQVQEKPTAWKTVSGGKTGVAKNLAETPDVTFQYQPVKIGAVVWMKARVVAQEEGDSETHYWFECAQNADCDPGVSKPLLSVGSYRAPATDFWSVVKNPGAGFTLAVPTNVFYDPSSGIFTGNARFLYVDDTGRIVGVSPQFEGGVVFRAADCDDEQGGSGDVDGRMIIVQAAP